MKKSRTSKIFLCGIGFAFCALIFCQCRAEKPKEVGMAEASGIGLWQKLAKADYKSTWRMWPGKSAFYPGTQPHGALLSTYVNDTAYEAVEAKSGKMPEGAIVVKENYSPGKELMAITVMYKIKGYNPEVGDWFWVKYGPDGKIEGEGKIQMCIGCHTAKADNDYLFTGLLK